MIFSISCFFESDLKIKFHRDSGAITKGGFQQHVLHFYDEFLGVFCDISFCVTLVYQQTQNTNHAKNRTKKYCKKHVVKQTTCLGIFVAFVFSWEIFCFVFWVVFIVVGPLSITYNVLLWFLWILEEFSILKNFFSVLHFDMCTCFLVLRHLSWFIVALYAIK